MTELLKLGQMNLYLGVKPAESTITLNGIIKRRVVLKCADGVIREEEGGTSNYGRLVCFHSLYIVNMISYTKASSVFSIISLTSACIPKVVVME